MSPSWINWEGEEGVRYTAHYTVPDWQCLHSGLGHGVRAHQDVLKEAHSGILCILPIRYSSAGLTNLSHTVSAQVEPKAGVVQAGGEAVICVRALEGFLSEFIDQ